MWRSRRLLLGLLLLFALGLSLGAPPPTTQAAGTINLTSFGSPYTQDFNTLASSGTANTTVPNGWEFSESGTNANTTYRAGTGSDTTGDTYSFGATGNSERAFGGLRSGALVPLVGAQITNNTGATITSLSLAYTGEQWRLGQNTTGRAADRLDFQLSTNATSLTTGTWTDYDGLDFASPVVAGTVGALNGNVSPNRTAISFTITGLSIPNGASFWVRWADTDLIPGSDDGLAVDDFSLTANPSMADGAPGVASVDPTNGATNVLRDANITVTFNESVNVTGAWFTINCGVSGAHPATVSGGPTGFTLNPETDFAANETCTLTIVAAQVSDQDSNDPPDTMAANFTSTFTTQDVEVCGDPATPIHAIQGNGTTSPKVGQTVSIEGVVVGDYQPTNQFSGFYVQEEDTDADSDPTTSEGIFVFNTSLPVNPGDKVRVKGTVTEFTTSGVTLTELTNVTNFVGCGSGASVTPTTVTLPVTALSDWERYEGMLITIPQDLTVTENYTLGRFGEVSLSVGGRLFTPTNVTTPGASATALQDQNNRSRILLDDANGQQNIDPTRYPLGGLSASNTLRDGYTVNSLTGVLEQRFGVYRVQPVGPINFTAANPRSATPTPVSGRLKVASFNVLNYFNGDGLGGGFPTPRGANTLAEFNRQRAKIINAITAINADVLGLMEMENDARPYSAIEDLVGGLNAVAGAGTYAFIDTGVVGTDEIRVAMIYKPATVTPVGAYAILNSTVDPQFLDTKNRPTLAQTFRDNTTGAGFTVVVNHLKSKGSDCNDVGDPDTGDGQGNCNLTRVKAATALVNWLATDPTGSGDPDFLVIGDMNSYALEDPITAIKQGGFTDLVAKYVGSGAYSYVFDGQSGYLDHALGSASLTSQVTGATEWHINADEPIVLDYNTEFKSANQVNTFYSSEPYRASDHDPVIVGLALNAPPSVQAGGPYTGVEGAAVALTGAASDVDGDTLTVGWTYTPSAGVDAGATCAFSNAAALNTTVTCTDDGTYTLTLTARDNLNAPVRSTVTLTVANANPALVITTPTQADPVAVGTTVNLSASFTDAGINDTHTCAINWDDPTSPNGAPFAATETAGAGTCAGSRVFTTAGVYTVQVTATDDDGGPATQSALVVVYDPSAGFVTGGGWITSPAGAYRLDPTLTGRANFGFVSKYQRGASTPTGQTEFQFSAANFTFHSASYQWLVVSGAKAQYKGTGTVNGAGNYGFLLTATDSQVNGGGGADRFRIKIWDRDNGDAVIYDNVYGASDDIDAANPQLLGGGSIVIHRGN